MVKDFNIHTIYQSQRHIIQCPQREYLNKAAEYFKFDVSSVDLYAVEKGERRKITPYEISDLMKIEIVTKSSTVMDGPRTLRSNFAGESSTKATFVEKIMNKLKNNTPLSGPERKHIIEWLQEYSQNSGVKRKIDHVDDSRPAVAHKKVQACTATTKDSFAQTDIINLTPADASKKEQTLIKLKKLAQNGETNKEEIAILMKESFEDRRNFIIIKVPPVASVKDKYPLLFSVEEVKNELDRIFYPGKCVEFLSNMDKYASLIVSECTRFTEIYNRTEKSMERAHSDQQRKYAEVVGSVLMLPFLLEEPLSFINLQDNYHESDVYPYIDARTHAIKEIFFDNVLYKVLVEGQLLCEASNFKEAILCLVAAYYIFNIHYSESCCRTLILFEKLFLDSNESADIDEHTSELIKKFKYKTVWH